MNSDWTIKQYCLIEILKKLLFIIITYDYLYMIATSVFETLLSIWILFCGPGSI